MLRKQFHQVIITSVIVICLLSVLPATALGEEKGFTDIPKDHWAYKSVDWAYEKGIVSGYPDGTFKPDETVTQTEFIAMLIRAYMNPDQLPQEEGDYWWSPYMNYALFNMKWGGSIITPPSSKNTELYPSRKYDFQMTRNNTAHLIASTNNRNYNTEDSIQYLLDKGLAAGKTANSIEGFQGQNFLTRAEAVTFIMNIREKQDALYPSLAKYSSYDPATLYLNGFEYHPLDYTEPPIDDISRTRYSTVIFTTPSKGYSLVNKPSFTLEGTVKEAVGENLHVNVEYWDSVFFEPVTTLEGSMKDGKFSISIDFPKIGVYRITVISDHFSDGKQYEEGKELSSFYVEYREK